MLSVITSVMLPSLYRPAGPYCRVRASSQLECDLQLAPASLFLYMCRCKLLFAALRVARLEQLQ